MRKTTFITAPLLTLSALALTATPALAHGAGHASSTAPVGGYTQMSDQWNGEAQLDSLNNSGTTGQAMIDVEGDQATVTVSVKGAAETFMDGAFPHAQHIHIAGKGVCPTPDADKDGDGAVNVKEGMGAYGMIGASLTTEGDTSPDSALAVTRFPGGGAYEYKRTIELDDATKASLADGNAVVVVHGVDPTVLSKEAQGKPSELDPSLPLAATLPAACGTVTASQVSVMPEGAADTGVAPDNTGVLLGAGAAGLALLGASAVAVRRRAARS